MASQQLDNSVTSPVLEKVNLLGMGEDSLVAYFEELGERKFRARQLLK